MQVPDYIKNLKDKSKTVKVHTKHQLTGLQISGILGDESHKTFYIKLAKYNNAQDLINLARISTEKKEIEKPGAYFIKIAKERGYIDKIPKIKIPKQQKIKFKRNVNKKRKSKNLDG